MILNFSPRHPKLLRIQYTIIDNGIKNKNARSQKRNIENELIKHLEKACSSIFAKYSSNWTFSINNLPL